MSERKEFQPLAKGAKETCSYPCGNLEHDHYCEIEDQERARLHFLSIEK
jgi:hypothetical protein